MRSTNEKRNPGTLMMESQPALLTYRNRCPACHSASYRRLLEEPFSSPAMRDYIERQYEGRADAEPLREHKYEVLQCSQCALVFQNGVPRGRLLSDIYERWIPDSERERLQERYFLDDYRYWAEQIQFVILRLDMRPSDIEVLDYGLGWSEWARMAAAFGCRTSGTELSASRARYAQSLGINVLPHDELPSSHFHFINTEQVFEHLVDPRETLERLASALRPGGVVKISVPNARRTIRKIAARRTFSALTAEEIVPIAPLEHVNCFEVKSLIRLGREVGLRVERPSLLQLYNSAVGWLEPKRAARMLARPIYRHVFPKSTYVFFSKE